MGDPNFGANFRIHREAAWLGAFPSRSVLYTCAKPVHLRQTTNREQPHFRADFTAKISSKTRARDTSISAPILHESDASLVMHHFRTVFRPFSLWSGAQFPVMHHFLGKCDAFADPFAPRRSAERPSLSHLNEEPESAPQAVQHWRRPRIFARPRKPTCTYERIPHGDEFSYDSTNNYTAASPQSILLQRRWQFLAPHASPLFPPQIWDAPLNRAIANFQNS